jgi:iron complex outermembrane receptor protein
LIARVDVVTGGASAAYGSDAVSGVVNFILDTKFTGLKGQAQAGISKYGDGQSYKFNIAGGFNVTSNVHALFSYDHYQIKGIKDNYQRPYGYLNIARTGTGSAANPYIDYPDVRYATATYGTLISDVAANRANPLRNYQFVAGGLAVPFNPGITTGSQGYNRGGDGVFSIGKTLTGTQNTDQAFGRVDIDLGGGISAFVQGTYADSFNSFITIGSGTQIGDFQIFTENPFIADSTRSILQAAGVRSFVAGRIEADQPPKLARFRNKVFTGLTGLKGKLGGFDWNVGYAKGDSTLKAAHEGNFENARWLAALDAVRAPDGRVVCRITLTNPALQPNCVPINIFGNGSPSKQAYDYVSQISRYRVKQKMDIFSGNISGDVFALPAGPVSVAVGGEYRKQSLLQTSNSDPTRSIDLTGIRTNVPPFILQYNSTNVGFARGKLNVKEAYGEVAVPILKDSPLGMSLDLNGAARYTDYSTSGSVVTWKVGVSYRPFESLRLRATQSRDIRAPTLYELYAGATAARGPFNDRLTNLNQNVISYTQGNPDLKPEKADTFTGGIVFTPSFVPRLSMSADFYSIKIKQAIGTLSLDTIQAQCDASNGTSPVCDAIVRPFPYSNTSAENFPTATNVIPFNQASQNVRGLDYEISYRVPLGQMIFGDANVDLRLIGTRLIDYKTKTSTTAASIQSNNSGNNVKDRINLIATYIDGGFSLNGQLRYFGKAKRTQDPTIFYVKNDIKDVIYTDLTAQYKFAVGGMNLEAYVTVNNVFNTAPPLFAGGAQPGQGYPTNTTVYDVIGRFYTGGLRVRF